MFQTVLLCLFSKSESLAIKKFQGCLFNSTTKQLCWFWLGLVNCLHSTSTGARGYFLDLC